MNRFVSFVYMEDCRSVLDCINATADAFARHAIDHRRVHALNRLCETALKTLGQMKRLEEQVSAEHIVRDVCYDDKGNPRAVDFAPLDPLSARPAPPDSAASADSAGAANPHISQADCRFW